MITDSTLSPLHIISIFHRIGEKQIKNLLKIAAFSKDKTLKEESQVEMREQCLKLWEVTIAVILFN